MFKDRSIFGYNMSRVTLPDHSKKKTYLKDELTAHSTRIFRARDDINTKKDFDSSEWEEVSPAGIGITYVGLYSDLPDHTINIGNLYDVASWNVSNPTKFAGLYIAESSGWRKIGRAVFKWEHITEKPTFATVATSGSYNDLTDTPVSSLSWERLVTKWSSIPTLNKSITGGDVYNYTLGGTTRYRFVGSTYDPSQDCFYENFDSSTDTLSGSIVCRGV